MKVADKAYRWGRLFALLESVGASDAEDLPRIMRGPGVFFGRCAARALDSPRRGEAEKGLLDLALFLRVSDVSDARLGDDAQSGFLLGYCAGKERSARPPRPIERRIDWSKVDFSKSDRRLGRELDVAHKTVWTHRRRRAELEKRPAPERDGAFSVPFRVPRTEAAEESPPRTAAHEGAGKPLRLAEPEERGKSRLRDVAKPFLLGRLFALFEIVGAADEKEIPRIARNPGEGFAGRLARASASPRLGEVERDAVRLTRALTASDVADAELGEEAQGQFLLGYLKQKKLAARRRRRPIDWTAVDFGRGDSVLARELGVSPQRVNFQKRRFARLGKPVSSPPRAARAEASSDGGAEERLAEADAGGKGDVLDAAKKPFVLGRLFALLESVGASEEKAVPRIARDPGGSFAGSLARAMASPRRGEIEREALRLAGALTASDVAGGEADDAAQAQFLAGYCGRKTSAARAEPRFVGEIDWDAVDFGKTNKELARELGVCPKTVWRRRRLRGRSDG